MGRIKRIRTDFLLYLLISVVLPLIISGTLAVSLSSGTIQRELLHASNHQVDLIIERVEEFFSESRMLMDRIAITLKKGISHRDRYFTTMEYILTDIYPYILGIQIANNEGIVQKIHPHDELIILSDISGHEYYKKTREINSYYWSPSFMSELNEEPVVSYSLNNGDFLITLFLSLKDINSLANTGGAERNTLLTITDQRGIYISHPDKNHVLLRENDPYYRYFKEKWKGGKLQEEIFYKKSVYFANIYFMPETQWKVSLYQPVSTVYTPVRILSVTLTCIFLMLLITAFFLGRRFNIRINRAFEQLLISTNKISQGKYSLMIPDFDYSEFEKLSESFKVMVTRIKEREEALKATRNELKEHRDNLERIVQTRTSELKNTIHNLQQTQEQLVESEKLASLGSLVAGISHEINTPLGIILTSSSFIEEELKVMIKSLNNSTLTKKNLSEHLNNIIATAQLIENNSLRASDLVKSFKEVSADQTSEVQRNFAIVPYLNSILVSLKTQFKEKEVNITVTGEETYHWFSYPGAFTQIISNLVMNSYFHGFEGSLQGEIFIHLEKQRDNYVLTYRDTGKGMDSTSLSRIFDPFYTTRRGAGGTGLGMHIVYSLVTQRFNGAITCSSTPLKGVTFKLTFPVKLSDNKEIHNH